MLGCRVVRAGGEQPRPFNIPTIESGGIVFNTVIIIIIIIIMLCWSKLRISGQAFGKWVIAAYNGAVRKMPCTYLYGLGLLLEPRSFVFSP